MGLSEYILPHIELRKSLIDTIISNIWSAIIPKAGGPMAASPVHGPAEGNDDAKRCPPAPDPLSAEDELFDPEKYSDPEDCVPQPGEDRLTAEELAEVREAAREQAAEDAGIVAEMARLSGTLGMIAAAAVLWVPKRHATWAYAPRRP
jgi:hypothetical protein